MPRRRWPARLIRWAGVLALLFIVITAAPVLVLRWVDPPTSAFIVASRIEAWRAGEQAYQPRYEWTDFEQISPHAAVAVIAAEDQLFPYHFGFDLESIREAVEANGRGKRLRGASTITQQVAKNLFLWRDRTWVRKGLEAWFTLLIETFWPKQRILEVYLNVAEFGRGTYGVEAASRRFYRKPAARLTAAEAALLAAVLPNPRRFRVERPSRYVYSRQEWILGQMQDLGGTSYLEELKQNGRASNRIHGRKLSSGCCASYPDDVSMKAA